MGMTERPAWCRSITKPFYAYEFGESFECRKIVRLSTDIYAAYGAKQATVLHAATTINRTEELRALISEGADVNASDSEGRTPLHWAARRHNPAGCALLLAAGANPCAKSFGGLRPIDEVHVVQGKEWSEWNRRGSTTQEILEPAIARWNKDRLTEVANAARPGDDLRSDHHRSLDGRQRYGRDM